MRHFLSTETWQQHELQAILDRAARYKRDGHGADLAGKSIALLFFNPSMRTRTSFELGAFQLGAHAIVLQPGRDAWPVEFAPGVVMDGEAEEHVAEVARVLSRYCDLIAVRAFPKFRDWSADREDPVLSAFAEYAQVPVINMESIVHPCQELALMLTLQERLGQVAGKKFLLTWTWHPKPLNTAVANSALLIASKFGMQLTLLCPEQAYLPDHRYLDAARAAADAHNTRFEVTHDIDEAYHAADVVYAKSWGALPYFGRWEDEQPVRDQYRHFIVDEEKMAKTNNAIFSHCLPLRRNVKATDAVMDADYCVAIDEAENRLHVQKALMTTLAGEKE
ncbi:MAG: N-acetylornithine carbamoyltransferase [Gammaproteobacteria bacterium]|nr:N-acetylornithine carbamoyltransferase [Gammaproteobacteria bacterium]